MSGPCSLPAGPKSRWEELNEIVCDVHFKCNMADFDKKGNVVKHDYITFREWLLRRNRLQTTRRV